MKRRNNYIASTLVLALGLMVGFPTTARPQFGKGTERIFKSPDKFISPIASIPQMVE